MQSMRAKRLAVLPIKDLVGEEYIFNGHGISQNVLIDESRRSAKTSIFVNPSALDLQKCYMDALNETAKQVGRAKWEPRTLLKMVVDLG